MQIRTTWDAISPSGWHPDRTYNNKIGMDVEKLELPYIAGENVNGETTLENSSPIPRNVV